MIKRDSTGAIVITSEGSKMQCNDHGHPPLDWTAELKIKPTERRKWLHKTEDLNTFLCTYEARYVPKLWSRHVVYVQTSCCLTAVVWCCSDLSCSLLFCYVVLLRCCHLPVVWQPTNDPLMAKPKSHKLCSGFGFRHSFSGLLTFWECAGYMKFSDNLSAQYWKAQPHSRFKAQSWKDTRET